MDITVLIDRSSIAERVGEMAEELTRTYGKGGVVVVGILGGAFIFMADLVRRGDFASDIDFLWLESYQGTASTGSIGVRNDVRVDMKGKDVLVIDDILDTGLTLDFTRRHLLDKGARSVRAAVLVRKDREGVNTALADHVGFVIPDRFVVGYGLDYNGRFRHLPDLCQFAPGETP